VNYKYLYQIGNFVSQLGVKEWHPLELLPDGRGAECYDSFAVSYKELSKYIRKTNKLTKTKLKRIDFF